MRAAVVAKSEESTTIEPEHIAKVDECLWTQQALCISS